MTVESLDNFLMNLYVDYNSEEIFDNYDINNDGLLDANEQVSVWSDAIKGEGVFFLDAALDGIQMKAYDIIEKV